MIENERCSDDIARDSLAAGTCRAGEAALEDGEGSTGADSARDEGTHGEARGLLDGGPEPVSGSG